MHLTLPLLLAAALACPFDRFAAAQPAPGPPAARRFAERSAELGLDFRHRHFGSGEKFMPENMAPGVVIFDYDGDGRLDLYLVQGAPLGPDRVRPDPAVTNRLFRQREDGSFLDVTARSGVGDTGYGMGASSGDFDGDGLADLYVANFGPDRLYRNRGDGSFVDVTAASGLGGNSWSVGSGFFDADGDGDLDLFVVHYVDFGFDNHKWCGNAQSGIRSYCHPDVYNGLPDTLYRNNGDGTFTDVSRAAGILDTPADKGLGLAFADFDRDGGVDVYVGNDSTMNYLYLSDGRGGFREGALLAGVGFNGDGDAEASMGVEVGDVDGDGLAELFVTHLDQETNTLYRERGAAGWADVTAASGLASPSLAWVGFGTVLFDRDLDGDLDLFVANGHILDNIELFDPTRSHRQPAQLFDNDGGGRFTEVSAELGLPEPLVGRGAATGDLDRDGDLDLVVAQNDGPLVVLINQSDPHNGWLAVRPLGAPGNPGAFGGRAELCAARASGADSPSCQSREILSARSYASQGSADQHFGLAAASAASLTLHWPDGHRTRWQNLRPGAYYIAPER